MVSDIREDKHIKLWFQAQEFAPSTRDTYAVYMQLFCECVDRTPSAVVQEANLETRKGLLLNERKAVEYFAKFKDCLTKANYAQKTLGLAFSAVKSFYLFNDIQLSSVIGKNKKRMPHRENQEFLTWDEVKKLLDNAGSLRNRAIILVMASGGVSRREILNMKFKAIVFDESGIGIIAMRRQKVQFDFTTFISPEACEALKLYFAERERTPGMEKKGDDDFVFVSYKTGYRFKKGSPIKQRDFTHIFRELGVKLGFKNSVGWIKSRSHGLRKFFSSTLLNAGIPKDKIDFMLAHVPDSVSAAYFQQDIPKLKELYIQNVQRLSFNKASPVFSLQSEDKKKLETLENENALLKTKMEQHNLDFRIQIESLERKLDVLSLMSRKDQGEVEDYEGQVFTELVVKNRKREKSEAKKI